MNFFILSSNSEEAKTEKISVKTSHSKGFTTETDEDMDKIIILDSAAGRDRVDVAKKLKINQLETDFSTKFYKATSKTDFKIKKKPEFKVYKIESGDDWVSISEKLFNDKNHWTQLQLWNEDMLNNIDLPEGKEIRYIKNSP